MTYAVPPRARSSAKIRSASRTAASASGSPVRRACGSHAQRSSPRRDRTCNVLIADPPTLQDAHASRSVGPHVGNLGTEERRRWPLAAGHWQARERGTTAIRRRLDDTRAPDRLVNNHVAACIALSLLASRCRGGDVASGSGAPGESFGKPQAFPVCPWTPWTPRKQSRWAIRRCIVLPPIISQCDNIYHRSPEERKRAQR